MGGALLALQSSVCRFDLDLRMHRHRSAPLSAFRFDRHVSAAPGLSIFGSDTTGTPNLASIPGVPSASILRGSRRRLDLLRDPRAKPIGKHVRRVEVPPRLERALRRLAYVLPDGARGESGAVGKASDLSSDPTPREWRERGPLVKAWSA